MWRSVFIQSPRVLKGTRKVYMQCTGWSIMPEKVSLQCRAGELAIITVLIKELKDNFEVRVSESSSWTGTLRSRVS